MDPLRGYEFLDAGDGRRLERFGERVVDRPASTALQPVRDPGAWEAADLRYQRHTGWQGERSSEPWTVDLDGLTFELRATDSGQVGLFPEQVPNWAWLRGAIAAIPAGASDVLNLFAYTGAASLVAAGAGARVAHVDGSRPTVAWARHNAELSGLGDRPIRWLVDDATGFVARETRRGRAYGGLVLDPPTYGHGPGGRPWRLDEDLDELLGACLRLARPMPAFVLLTAHTPGFGPERLAAALAAALSAAVGRPARGVESGELGLTARSWVRLPLGSFARWSNPAPVSGR